VFEQRIPIRYRDTDALGHVNNAVYLTYVEELLLHWLGPVLGDDFVSARVELDFRSELPGGETSLEGRVVVVAWDPRKRRSRPLSDEEKEEIRRRQD
jgi:acyl-CoA thioesterase FadM